MKYFSYWPDDGFELHRTKQEAKQRAETALQIEQDIKDGITSEFIDQICWGEITERAKLSKNSDSNQYELRGDNSKSAITLLQGAIDIANTYATDPHNDLRLVTLRMDDALCIMDALLEKLKTAKTTCRNCLGFGWEPTVYGERIPCKFCGTAAESSGSNQKHK